MKYIAIDEIKEGMKLARDVVTSCGKTLLRKDLVLRAHFVHGLRWHQVTHILVQDDAQSAEHMPLLSPGTKLKAIDIAKTMFSDIKMGRLLNDQHITALVGEMVDELLSQTKLLICLHRMGRVEDYLIEHSINTTIISIVIGLRCGFPREKLLSLAKGAFLHDIGKTKIPDTILHKRGPLTTAEFERIKLHPQLGFNIIREMADCNIQTAMISLQHHERFDGAGYPTYLSGGQIHEFSRIVAIADVYDALTTDRCYRQGYTPDKALEVMVKDRGVHFDPLLYDIFASEVVIYPIGTFVELSDGSLGSVVGLTRDVHRPEISLFSAKEDGSFASRRINLLLEPHLSIRGSI